MAIDIRVELRAFIARKYKTQKAAAEAWGCSQSNVSMMLADKQEPTDAMLKDAGFKRYVPRAVAVKPRYSKA